MNQKRFTEGKAPKSGFYVALAVCLAAVGIAAWSTYDSVNSYLEPAEASSLTEQQEEEVPGPGNRRPAGEFLSGGGCCLPGG